MSQTSDLHALLTGHMAARRAAGLLAPESIALTTRTARSVVRMAKRLNRMYEADCSEEGAEERNAAPEARLEAKIRTALEWYGLTVAFNGDPRGFPVLIHGLTSKSGCIAYNTWGGAEHGYGIG